MLTFRSDPDKVDGKAAQHRSITTQEEERNDLRSEITQNIQTSKVRVNHNRCQTLCSLHLILESYRLLPAREFVRFRLLVGTFNAQRSRIPHVHIALLALLVALLIEYDVCLLDVNTSLCSRFQRQNCYDGFSPQLMPRKTVNQSFRSISMSNRGCKYHAEQLE